jgi:glycosyltransferase involved in cell wall biosynthesis
LQIPRAVEDVASWKPAAKRPKVGLVGWNTAQGLGYLNRDLVTNIPIHRWIVPKHPKFEELRDMVGTNMVHVPLQSQPDQLRPIVGDLDWMMFCELPYIQNFAGVTRECGVPNVCIPMWEWLHQQLDWLKFVDIFMSPTKACHEMLKVWRKEMGLKWDLHYVPAPIDTNIFKFTKRNQCQTFLFNNGTGGGEAWTRGGGRHPPRKGIDVILEVAKRLPNIPFIVRSQVEVPAVTPNVTLISASATREELYELGDVAIQPSRYEGLGLQALECQACGMPLITIDAPPMNEYHPMAMARCTRAEGRVLGERYIDVYHPDVDHLTSIVSSLYMQDIGEESEKSRQFIEQEHSWSMVSKQMMDLLGFVK